MDPLGTPGGRQHVRAQLDRVLAILAEDEADDAEDEYGWHDRVFAGLAWEHDPAAGIVVAVRPLPSYDGETGHPGAPPDEWDHEINRRFELPRLRLDLGRALVDVLRLTHLGDPTEAVAAAVAAEGDTRGWPGLRLAPGFRAWTRRDGCWTPAASPPPAPPARHPDLPHLSEYIADDRLAGRVRGRIAALTEEARRALSGLGSPLCGVALFAIDDGPLSLGYLFALTTTERDAHPDPARLLVDPASWPERTSPMAEDDPEGEALAQALVDAGCFEPEAALHREIADRLRAGPWTGIPVADDLVVVAAAA